MIDVTEFQRHGVDRFAVREPMRPAQFDALARDILALKKRLNAVILAHNYQVPEIQDVADYVGDSLGLSQQAAKTSAEVIVFCGVHFMAETAKILNPRKLVLLPDADAGCSLEESCPAPKLQARQATNPNFYTISYINCSAAVKALSDVICTSGNAVRIVNAAPPERDLLFAPDENLGAWVMEQTGRPMTLWRGNCYAHVEFTHASIMRIRREFPDAPVVAHPECTKAVRMLANEICSTEKMVGYCKQSPARQFIIATEAGMLHRLKKECPDKIFIPAPTDNCRCNECKFMKMNTIEKLHDCMETLAPRIELSDEIIGRARRPIERMLEISARPQGAIARRLAFRRQKSECKAVLGRTVAAWVAGPGEEEAAPCAQNRKSRKIHMSVFDLIKATAVCGLTAFLVYSFPVIGQIAIIGLLGLLWLSCAHQVIQSVRRKWFA